MDDEASAAVARSVNEAAAANPTKGKPKKGKAVGKAKAKAAPKGTVMEASFRIDIGSTRATVELDKKELSKKLNEAVVFPALRAYLADKPACIREPLSKHPSDASVVIDNEVCDGGAASKEYIDREAAYTHVTVMLPQCTCPSPPVS